MTFARLGAIIFIFHLMLACTIIESDAWPANEKKILLSFDDGPNGSVSSALLDVLAKHKVRATFCYVGRNVEKHPGIVKRAVDEGHEIVVHSFSRRFPTFFDYDTLKNDIEKTRSIILAASQRPDLNINYYRPPSGLLTPTVRRLTKRTHFELAYINFYAHDAAIDADNLDKLMEKTKTEIDKRNGASIVFHESRFRPKSEQDNLINKEWLPLAVDDFIVWAKRRGYTFVSFSDKPGDPGNN